MLKFTCPYSGSRMDAAFVRDAYANNHRLYVGLYTYDKDDAFWEPWSDVTVNLSDESISDENCAFIDVNNNPTITSFLEQNGIAVPTYRFGYSGFCSYPEYRFDIDKLDEHLMNR